MSDSTWMDSYFKVREEQAREAEAYERKIVRIAVKYEALCDAAESAAAWLCESHPGSDQWERGVALRKALDATRNRKSTREQGVAS